MKVVVAGAGGMLGCDVVAAAPSQHQVVALDRRALDITDAGAVRRAFEAHRPQVVINAAGYTAVDAAEGDADAAMRVNSEAVATLAGAALEHDALLVHFSTDYVFGGTASEPYGEDAIPDPRSAYGRSKLAGDVAIAASGARALVVRSSWLFGKCGRSFPRTMLERARRREPTRVVTDQVGRPTYTPDLARAVWELVDAGASGVVNVANEGAASWFDVARVVFDRVDAGSLLHPCTTAEYPTAARRPAYSVLSTARFRAQVGHALPPWEDALDRFLSELGA